MTGLSTFFIVLAALLTWQVLKFAAGALIHANYMRQRAKLQRMRGMSFTPTNDQTT